MASPFRFFRKNQKLMLALLCGMAMIAFVFLPPLARTMDSAGGGGSGRTIRTSFGDLTAAELSQRVRTRNVLDSVLQRAYGQAIAKVRGGTSESIPKRQPLPFQHGERGAIDNMVLARTAEKLGFVVPNETVNAYLRDLTGENLSNREFQEIIRASRGYNEAAVFEALREELLALELVNAFYMPRPSTPAEWWRVYRQLHDQVTIEFVPVHVEDFVHLIEEPSEEEIETLYNAYKDRIPQPDQMGGVLMESPLPGFKRPRRGRFEYVRADHVKMAELATAAVTDEQIEEYYNTHRTEFVDLDLPSTTSSRETPSQGDVSTEDTGGTTEDTGGTTEDTGGTTEDTGGTTEDTGGTTEDTGGTTEDTGGTTEDTGGTTEDTGGTTEDTGGTTEDTGGTTEDTGGTTEDTGGTTEDTGGTTEDTGGGASPTGASEPAVRDPRPGRPPEPLPESDAAPPVGGQGSLPLRPAAKGSAVRLTAYQNPAETTGASDTGRPPAPLDSPAAGAAADTDPPSTSSPPEPATSEPEPLKFKPLEEVADQIRESLGNANAANQALELLAEVRAPMESYYQARSDWEADQFDLPEGQQPPPAPTPPNLAELVGDLPLTTGSTELLSLFELHDTPLGSSISVDDSGAMFAVLALATPDSEKNVYRPLLTQDGERNFYLAWKVDDEPEQTLPLEEVRSQVIAHWKADKALEKARQRAQEMAGSARQLGLTLQESLSDTPHLKVRRSEPFTRLTRGPVPQTQSARVMLSEIEGIEGADEAFMEKVFDLAPEEIVVVENHAREVVYVVRLAGRGIPLDALRDRFLADYSMAANLADQSAVRSMRAALVEQVSQDAQIQLVP